MIVSQQPGMLTPCLLLKPFDTGTAPGLHQHGMKWSKDSSGMRSIFFVSLFCVITVNWVACFFPFLLLVASSQKKKSKSLISSALIVHSLPPLIPSYTIQGSGSRRLSVRSILGNTRYYLYHLFGQVAPYCPDRNSFLHNHYGENNTSCYPGGYAACEYDHGYYSWCAKCRYV